ncbi:hypothetical protein VTJ83DRAFT_7227 [Remersonia thermophila]|uniref:FAD dependent oxidoreductase domain-containing protein n=1 Tax=Remersonia thermophila TaxID=72144 RepID=A0ABR4D339_9PEZI
MTLRQLPLAVQGAALDADARLPPHTPEPHPSSTSEMGIHPGIVTSPPSGLPSADPTSSYWLRDPNPALLGHRGTPDLPAEADVVVVGSGLTGTFAARFLLEGSSPTHAEEKEGRDPGVVMLEAREVCWGATGRNGGHCQPLVYGAAPAVAAFELSVYDFMEQLVKDEAIDCDWVSLTGVHAFLSKDMFDGAVAAAEQLAQSHPELAANLEIIRRDDPSSTEEKQQRTLASLRIPTAYGAIIQKKAASLWPYKLVASILERLVAAHPPPRFNLQTNTPVTSLARSDDGTGRWTLTTPRGSITARQVLLATNGYTSHLLPAFADLIVPVRGQVASLLPPLSQPSPRGGEAAPALRHSYVFAADPEPARAPAMESGDSKASAAAPRDDYLVQRPLPTGELIYGGGRRLARALGVGEWRDDVVEGGVARYLRRNLCPPLDLLTPTDADSDGRATEAWNEKHLELSATHEWTGVMGYSRDRHAWVGAIPEALGGGDGLFLCAGYTGHGMPAAALSARAVVVQMRKGGEGGAAQDTPELPAEFVLSEERVARARGMPHLTGGWEATNFAELIGA